METTADLLLVTVRDKETVTVLITLPPTLTLVGKR